VSGNRAEGNGRGLFLENAIGNELTGNVLAGNGVGAYLTAGSEANRLSGNAFRRNLVQVYEAHAGDNLWHVEGRGNFWSDYVGFDWNGDGVGETPYRLQTAASALMARRPHARFLAMSPLLSLLDFWEARTRLASPAGFDPFPLVVNDERDLP
jgi:nitrous oxidase accessory protein